MADYQARVPIREYEWFWNTYWKDAYPRLDNITWPGQIPVLRPLQRHHQRRDEVHPRVVGDGEVQHEGRVHHHRAVPALLTRTAKLFTGKFFFLGGSTDLRKQADGSLAGDLSGIAAGKSPGLPAPVHLSRRSISRS